MAGKWHPYNADIMAVTCPICAAEPKQRCRPQPGNVTYPKGPHKGRIDKAKEAKE